MLNEALSLILAAAFVLLFGYAAWGHNVPKIVISIGGVIAAAGAYLYSSNNVELVGLAMILLGVLLPEKILGRTAKAKTKQSSPS